MKLNEVNVCHFHVDILCLFEFELRVPKGASHKQLKA